VLVVDTSAVFAALVGRPPDRRLVDRLRVDGDLHAPTCSTSSSSMPSAASCSLGS
jgi:hypothetical protein